MYSVWPPLSFPPSDAARPAQVFAASGLYVVSVVIYSAPPLTEWRLVLGLVFGLKAQILFMAPFTAAFSRLIGSSRVTNGLTTTLCLAPLIGASIGTAGAPLLLPHAGSLLFVGSALPALVGLLLLPVGRRLLAGSDVRDGGAPRVPIGGSTRHHIGAVKSLPPSRQASAAGTPLGGTTPKFAVTASAFDGQVPPLDLPSAMPPAALVPAVFEALERDAPARFSGSLPTPRPSPVRAPTQGAAPTPSPLGARSGGASRSPEEAEP